MNDLAQSLEIGPVTVPNRVFLAPMSGVSDLPFRKRAQAHCAGLVVSEMVASEELCKARPESLQRASGAGLSVRMVQLAGREAKWMSEAARIAEAGGANIIDINMGCPAKKVTGGYSGSALMRDLDHAMTLIKASVSAVDIPVTLKMRLGWDHESINAPELARRAVDAGIRMITVHGRTRMQLYNGDADWARVADVRAAVSVPLVVNGDIGDLTGAREALEMSGADAVMVGRECYGRPWLAGGIARASGYRGEAVEPQPSRAELAGYVVAHYEDMLDQYGTETGLRHARKHLGWYLDRHAGPGPAVKAARKRVLTSNNPGEVIRLIRDVLECPATQAEAA